MEKKAYVERIMAFITNQQTGRKEEGGEPTPVPPGPESWTIDGVTYYNRCVFDLDELMQQMIDDGQTGRYFDLLTKEIITSEDISTFHITDHYMGQYKLWSLDLYQGAGIGFTLKSETSASPVNFTSRAFDIVDTMQEVTDNTKICLPTCSAYYGFLSEDGKTFISYFNLKN